MRRLLAVLLALLPSLACAPEPCAEAPGLDDELCAGVRSLALPQALPPARGNRVADDERAAHLGRTVFFDARFSANLEVRCASCHAPELHFTDRRPRSEHGLGLVSRNSPTTLSSGRRGQHFWDGRADSLWSQPLFAIEAEAEMGFTRLEVAHRVAATFRAPYEEVFGPLPALDDDERYPARGKPGDPAFDLMAPADQHAVNQVFANVGKALEAYMRRSTSGSAPIDALLGGDEEALSPLQREGLVVFAQAGCLACHSGPLLSDESFSNLGVPPLPGEPPDEGRAVGARALAESAFSWFGPYADEPKAPAATRGALLDEADDPASLGAFLVPSLRGVARTAPYGHNGAFASLDEVLDHHLTGGAPGGFVGEVDQRLVPVALTDDEREALLAFLDALTGVSPPPPWDNWPDR